MRSEMKNINKILVETLIVFLAIIFVVMPKFFDSCGAKNNFMCNLSGYVIWEFNEYVGKKPDIGSTLYLFRSFKPNRYLDIKRVYSKETSRENGIFIKEVGVDGKYIMNDIPPGEYDLLVVSKSTKRNIFIEYGSNVDHSERYESFMRLTNESLNQLQKERENRPGDNANVVELEQYIKTINELQAIFNINTHSTLAHLDYSRLQKNILKKHFASKNHLTFVHLILNVNKFKVFENLSFKKK